MHHFIVWYYRFLDRHLRCRLNLGEREDFETGEWNRRIGDLGEDLARRWLWTHGMKVLYHQFTAPGGGEVDLIARDGNILVFCEVKTRTSKQFGRPGQAVDKEKQELISKGAQAWIMKLGDIPLLFRFDIIEVILINGEEPEITHIENAFQSLPRLLA